MPKYGPPKDIEFYDFSGGVNVADSEFVLRPNELSFAENVVPTKRGALTVRKGVQPYNDTKIESTGVVFGLARFYREAADGTDVVLAVAQLKLWSVPETGASTDLGLDYDGNANYAVGASPAHFAQYRDRMYMAQYRSYAVSGDNIMSVIADNPDGSGNLLAWAWGVTAPTVKPHETVGAGGTLDEKYKYKTTYWYGEDGGFGESNPSPASDEADCTTGTRKVEVEMFSADHDYADWDEAHDAGVGKVYIYRAEDSGSGYGPYYYTAEATSGLTYDDTGDTADATTSPPSDNYAPDEAKYLCVHEERMFTGWLKDSDGNIHPKRVRWSAAGFPDIFPNLNFVDAPAEHGDIMGLKVLNGILYVFFESAIGALRVYGEADAEFRIVSNEVGPIAPKTLVVASDGGVPCVFYQGRDYGVYRFDGQIAKRISWPVDSLIADEMAGYESTAAFALLSCAGWDGEVYHLYICRAASGLLTTMFQYNTRVLAVNPATGESQGTWWTMRYDGDTSPRYFSPRCFVRLDGGADKGELLVGGLGDGMVYWFDNGYDDKFSLTLPAKDIGFTFSTGRLNLGLAGYVKSPYKLLMDKESADDLTIKWEGGVEGTPTQSFTSEADEVRTRHMFTAHQPAYSFKYTISGTSTDTDSLPVIHGFVQRFIVLRED